ncbi:hypothetical protein KKG31_08665 [Patescibacteria group bacterium]|nr:hypothetical protein [Patescibacteria group bacterium]MBU1759125.1 hypothetical protein [Patescibacteria group bacterium]
MQAYIKDDKNKRKELNILHLTPARFSRYLTSLFISYNRTQEQKDQPGRKIQALNKTFEIQFLKTYKDKNKKKDSGVIYAKDINTDDELPQKEILEEKRNFTAEEITKISSDLKKIGNSTFYRLVEVREKISAKEMINLIYNIAQKAPETKEEAVQEFIQKFHNNEKEEDKKILEDFIRKAVKYFQKK